MTNKLSEGFIKIRNKKIDKLATRDMEGMSFEDLRSVYYDDQYRYYKDLPEMELNEEYDLYLRGYGCTYD